MNSSIPFRRPAPATSLSLDRTLIAFSAVLFLISSARAASAQGWAGPQSESLFTLVKTVTITPSGNYTNGDFVRIAYVPGRDRFIVTFNTTLDQPESGCPKAAYAYKEYTADMVETGQAGVISCHAASDTGGFFIGNDFYLASAERNNDVEGWNVAKFDAVTWASSVDYWYPFPDAQMMGFDPMVAYVNGQVDISSVYVDDPAGRPPNFVATHHHFFTTDLQFVSKRLLSDTQHSALNGMITQGGVIHFLSSTALLGNLIVMWYDPSWTYLGVKTLKESAGTPMGVAFDGNRFYVAYTTQERTNGGFPICENVRLAAFDTGWNVVDDIALTSHTLQEQTSAIHPWLEMKDNRLYVTYCENTAGGGVETLQASVKVFDLSTSFTPCTSFSISPTSASATASAGSQSVTVTGSPSGCGGGSWTASTSDSWLSVSPSNGSGSGSVVVSWPENARSSSRSGSVTIGGKTFSVTQSAGTTRRRAVRRPRHSLQSLPTP